MLPAFTVGTNENGLDSLQRGSLGIYQDRSFALSAEKSIDSVTQDINFVTFACSPSAEQQTDETSTSFRLVIILCHQNAP